LVVRHLQRPGRRKSLNTNDLRHYVPNKKNFRPGPPARLVFALFAPIWGIVLKHTLKHKKESKECWCQEEKVNDKF